MVNNRTFYAVKQLAIKNRQYAMNGFLLDSVTVVASGAHASGATLINFNPSLSVSGLPTSGQLITPSGEVIYYTTVSGTNLAVGNVTRGFVGTTANTITSGDELKYAGWEISHGVQSVGVTTNFSLEQVFEFGQIEIYENIEALPDVEVTVERVLDGTKPLWFMVTDAELETELTSATANYTVDVALNIYPDSQNRASGAHRRFMLMSGMFISSATYTYTVDGNFTESITLVGNDKTWLSSAVPTGAFTGVAEVATVVGSGVQRREDLSLTLSQFPTDLPGIPGAGVGNASSGLSEHLQTITLSVDIGREELFELGKKKPFFRTVTFPVEVTASFEVVTAEGDLVEAVSDNATNLSNQTIIVATNDGMTIDLGDSCKLSSIDFGGGDAGGGNDTVTYTYQTFNEFTVSHTNTNFTRKN